MRQLFDWLRLAGEDHCEKHNCDHHFIANEARLAKAGDSQPKKIGVEGNCPATEAQTIGLKKDIHDKDSGDWKNGGRSRKVREH